MGLFEDYEAEVQFAMDFPHGVPCDTWTTATGKKIKLNKMSEEHIRNCMKLIGEDDPWYPYFQKELERRKGLGVRNVRKRKPHNLG